MRSAVFFNWIPILVIDMLYIYYHPSVYMNRSRSSLSKLGREKNKKIKLGTESKLTFGRVHHILFLIAMSYNEMRQSFSLELPLWL